MEVEYGTLQDIESWMELVKEVRWNFPGLETREALEDHTLFMLYLQRTDNVCQYIDCSDGSECRQE